MNEMECKEIVEAITAYLDRTLADDDRRRFEHHLASCPHCTEYLVQMRRTIARLGTLDESTLSPGTRAQLVTAFRDWRSR